MAIQERPWLVAAAAGLGLAGVLAVSGFSAPAAAPGGWSKAITLRGLTNGPAAISCSSAGNCTAVGQVAASIYVAVQVHGKWGGPTVIPGTVRTRHPASSPGGIACFSDGCLVVGSYVDSAGHGQAFIVNQAHGAWGKLIWVPGLARLDRGHSAGLGGLWCPTAGNCTADGSYTDAAGTGHQFDVAEVHGTWGSAIPVPGVTGLPGQTPGTVAGFGTISCPSPGNCSAAGSYPISGGNQPFVISQVNGVWGSAIEMPGIAALNTGALASVYAISCASPGNCGAGGFYWTSSQFQDAFAINQVDGTWRPAIKLPGRLGAQSWISTISCPSPGNCGAGGIDNYENTERPFGDVFVVSEINGTWYRAQPIPGTLRLNVGDNASVSAISCPTAGNCGLGGYYTPGNVEAFQFWDAFVVTEIHGAWGKAIIVPGTGAENTTVIASITAMACTAPGLSCTAGGYLANNKTGFHAFVASTP